MLFKPDEAALDLFKRLNANTFELIHQTTVTRLNFGDSIEIQTSYSRFIEVS
jgi:hypothetical protein